MNSNHIDDLIKDDKDNNGKDAFVCMSIVLIPVCARKLHLLMVKSVCEGRFKNAYKQDVSGRVRFSENTLHTYWPNWLTLMTDADRIMCGCETCCSMDDINLTYKAKRRKIVCAAEANLDEMEERTTIPQ